MFCYDISGYSNWAAGVGIGFLVELRKVMVMRGSFLLGELVPGWYNCVYCVYVLALFWNDMVVIEFFVHKSYQNDQISSHSSLKASRHKMLNYITRSDSCKNCAFNPTLAGSSPVNKLEIGHISLQSIFFFEKWLTQWKKAVLCICHLIVGIWMHWVQASLKETAID